MPGNEEEVVKFLLENKSVISLNHLGKTVSIETPIANGEMQQLNTTGEIEEYLDSNDSNKKADIFINTKGISIKQTGGSKAFNKFQRKSALYILNLLTIEKPEKKLFKLDEAVKSFHKGQIKREIRWQDIFPEKDFKALLEHLMMKGSQTSLSSHPAEYILTSSKYPSLESLILYNFSEYFEKKKNLITISIRRIWTNQNSKSESGRAKSLAKNPDNLPWVFNDIVGKPRNGFNESEENKRTVYYLDISVLDE
jgi:hypothetical protein